MSTPQAPGPPPGPPPPPPRLAKKSVGDTPQQERASKPPRTDTAATPSASATATATASATTSAAASASSAAPAQTTASSSSAPRQPLTDDERRRKRQAEQNAFLQQLEIDRILTVAFKMNPYDILDVPTHADEKTIQRIFRRKSLLIHPDKVQGDAQRAHEAFGMLQQASTDLLDEERRKNIDSVVRSAERLALHELNLASEIEMDQIAQEEASGRLAGLIPSWQERVRECVKHFLVDEEVRKRRAQRMKQEAEIFARLRREEAEEELRRKAEPDTRWEDTREERVKGWRSFQKGAAKKRRKTSNVLG
ncbi:DnaJ sub C member 8 [Malassezia cuniculi]|uniref:DnaJ sub C member 8 n=1 Tax=Malassezia cuniculi TaxID=948313 RepID=A0AAF0J5Y1_9BASI|nr:DnaJ sub C member 8 [Malassezia cuniculi]